MCRRNLAAAAALAAFGCGLLVSLLVDSVLLRLCGAAALIFLGIAMLRGKCRS